MCTKQVIAMKTRAFPAVLCGIAVSCSAWAGDPIDPAALGNIDAMLATCREVNPGGKAAYDTLREGMLGEQPEGTLAALTQTPEYKQAYDSAREKAEAEPRDSALKGCTQLAGSLGPRVHQAARHATATSGKTTKITKTTKTTKPAKSAKSSGSAKSSTGQ